MGDNSFKRSEHKSFKKCDLHIHSSSCFSRSYTREEFFNAILESDLDVIAITDHNNVDVELIQDLAQKMDECGKQLLPGIELNLCLKSETINKYGLKPSTGKEKNYFHGVVLCSLTDLDRLAQAIGTLFSDKDGDSKPQDNKDDELYSAKELSKQRQNNLINLEDLQDQLDTIPHFFIPHENKSSRNLSDYLPNGNSSNESYKESMFYYSSGMAVEGGEKSRNRITTSMAEELNTTISALLFSDAKELDDIGRKYTWIDFDDDLDSLLLAVSDPESRIRTSDICPDLPQTNVKNYLASVTFDIKKKDGTKDSVSLSFAPGYNGIVGSRGSGKSMLAHILFNDAQNNYVDYIDPDSIRYGLIGSEPSKDRPECLHLTQGELAEIYEDQKYSNIPILEKYTKNAKERANAIYDEKLSNINHDIEIYKNLLTAFRELYPTGNVSIDFLNKVKPLGITIDTAESDLQSDGQQITNGINTLLSVEENLPKIINEVKGIKFEATYPEDIELFQALSEEVVEIDKELNAIREHIHNYSIILDSCNLIWFNNREKLLDMYNNIRTKYNKEEDGLAKTNYHNRQYDAMKFLENMLKVRLASKDIDNRIDNLYKEMISPIEPIAFQIADDEVTIKLNYKNDFTYHDYASDNLRMFQNNCPTALIYACLNQNDNDEIKTIFSGKRIKNKKCIDDYINNYFTLLMSDISGNKDLNMTVYLNDQSLENMSPGTQANALLKLYLHNRLSEGGYIYIILDQPEDNLDASTIKDFLIDRIKSLKLNIQLFIVSHSAPVIVNGDARNVVICNQDAEGNISYTSGTLNGKDSKHMIADVLDGGERYLKMRLNKYNFQIGDNK